MIRAHFLLSHAENEANSICQLCLRAGLPIVSYSHALLPKKDKIFFDRSVWAANKGGSTHLFNWEENHNLSVNSTPLFQRPFFVQTQFYYRELFSLTNTQCGDWTRWKFALLRHYFAKYNGFITWWVTFVCAMYSSKIR